MKDAYGFRQEQTGTKREFDALKKVISDLAIDNAIPQEAKDILIKAVDTSLVHVAKEVISASTHSKSAITRALGISRHPFKF